MTQIRKPFINAPTSGERVIQLKKELDRIVDEVNIALQEIDTEIRGKADGDET